MKNKRGVVAIVLIALFLGGMLYVSLDKFKGNSSNNNNAQTESKQEVLPADFLVDSCFAFIEKQIQFGPRVPGSKAHIQCGNWMVQKLKSYGAEVREQNTTAVNWDGSQVPIRNIMGSIRPNAPKRLLFCAHWDCRPYADKDANVASRKSPIDGANDGASGVAVILELARIANQLPEGVGMDIVFFDTEDGGKPEWAEEGQEDYKTWCLGSQYWARTNPKKNFKYAILLDMVGANGASFNKEGYSMEAAGNAVNRIWANAAKLGYGSYFVNNETSGIVDDHLFMIQQNIPTLDIIDMKPSAMGYGFEFGSFHHTHDDNLSVISKPTLKAVGHTLAYTLWNLN
jgi:glutaminyl-peptide cyclotransferase